MRDPSRKRHAAKTVTWRIIGTLDTMLLAWLITGDAMLGFQIGIAEILTKMLLYYLHERIWFNVALEKVNPNWRHIAKTVTWRIVGTIDTMLLAWIISGDPMIGIKVGLLEVITKMVLYYLHEKVWYRSNYGLNHRKTSSNALRNE